MRASSGAFRLSWFQPMRVLSVTGTFTAFTVASISLRRERQIAHQRRAGVAVDDLLHRAAHVDVDDRCAALLVELCRFGHHLRLAAGELERHRLLGRIPQRLLQRLAGLADHRLAGDHLADRQPRAIALDDPPERQVGDARHRRQDDRRVDPDRTDVDGLQLAHGLGGR